MEEKHNNINHIKSVIHDSALLFTLMKNSHSLAYFFLYSDVLHVLILFLFAFSLYMRSELLLLFFNNNKHIHISTPLFIRCMSCLFLFQSFVLLETHTYNPIHKQSERNP